MAKYYVANNDFGLGRRLTKYYKTVETAERKFNELKPHYKTLKLKVLQGQERKTLKSK